MLSIIKTKSLLVVLTVILITGITQVSVAQSQPKGKPWNPPDAAVKVKNPVTATVENLTEGKALYDKHCKSCHGAKGKGDGPKAANLDVSSGDFTSDEFKHETDGSIFYKISEGRDPMPTFKKKVSDEERWLIVNYLHTLGEKKK